MLKYYFLALFSLASISLLAQDCNCDVLLSNLSEDRINIINASSIAYQPGDTLCIPAGNYAGITFVGLHGTNDAYVTITNCGGKVVVTEPLKSAISFRNSSHIRLTGTGSTHVAYGIKVESALGQGAAGLNLSGFSSDFEIDHIEIQHTDFAGILGKLDPSCDDPATWRRNGHILKNLNIHHNYIHDTGAEGIYLGNTSGYLVTSSVQCNGEFVFAHWLEHIEVHHNLLERIGWDAIQLNLTRESGVVRENSIDGYGLKNEEFQNFAMSIAGGDYSIYNNYIINPDGGHGQGIQLLSAKSGSKVFNNVIVNPNFHAIFIHNRHEFDDMGKGYMIANNTLVNPAFSGIFYNTTITRSNVQGKIGNEQSMVPTFFINNFIVNPGNRYEDSNTWKGGVENFIDFNAIRTRDASRSRIRTNLFTRRVDTFCLASIENNDFRPVNHNSPLIDSGSNLSFEGIDFDINNTLRPNNGLFDVGAYEYQSELLDFECSTASEEILDNEWEDLEETVIFPNPAHQNIRFLNTRRSNCEIQLFTQNGRLIKSFPYQMGDDIYIGNLSQGVYIARLNFDSDWEIHKFIVE